MRVIVAVVLTLVAASQSFSGPDWDPKKQRRCLVYWVIRSNANSIKKIAFIDKIFPRQKALSDALHYAAILPNPEDISRIERKHKGFHIDKFKSDDLTVKIDKFPQLKVYINGNIKFRDKTTKKLYFDCLYETAHQFGSSLKNEKNSSFGLDEDDVIINGIPLPSVPLAKPLPIRIPDRRTLSKKSLLKENRKVRNISRRSKRSRSK